MKIFSGAQLRDESGAAITDEETINDLLKYAPSPGDTPETTAYKARARRSLIQAMIRKAGGAWDGYKYGQEIKVPTTKSVTKSGTTTKKKKKKGKTRQATFDDF